MHFKDEEKINSYLIKSIEIIKNNDKLFSIFQRLILDSELHLHSTNVAKLSTQLAINEGYNDDEIQEICLGAYLHDIGKLELDQSILYKTDKLTTEEFEHIKQHSQFGYDLLRDTGVSENIKLLVLNHHRHKNGKGYPITSEPFRQQDEIITIADIFSALSERRVYHPALSVLSTLEYISTFSNINKALLFRLPSLVRD